AGEGVLMSKRTGLSNLCGHLRDDELSQGVGGQDDYQTNESGSQRGSSTLDALFVATGSHPKITSVEDDDHSDEAEEGEDITHHTQDDGPDVGVRTETKGR